MTFLIWSLGGNSGVGAVIFCRFTVWFSARLFIFSKAAAHFKNKDDNITDLVSWSCCEK